MEYTEKQILQRREAVRKHTQEKADRVNCLLPKGTKERIKAVAPNKSINAFIKDVVLLQLEAMEKMQK